MTASPSSQDPVPPVDEAETDVRYSIEVIASLAGVDAHTVIHYQEQGFIRPVMQSAPDNSLFDAESLRQLRRIEHLRATCAVNDTGLKLILDLLHEVECLRDERRQRLR